MSKIDKAPITTHILDLDRGRPAAGMAVKLIAPSGDCRAKALSDSDGRIMHWPETFELISGVWALEFEAEPWFSSQQKTCFFNEIKLCFQVANPLEHYHVPLLLNAFGYSTYRGS